MVSARCGKRLSFVAAVVSGVFPVPVHLFLCKVNVRASHRIASVANSLMLSCYIIVQWVYANECNGECMLCIVRLFLGGGLVGALCTFCEGFTINDICADIRVVDRPVLMCSRPG